MFFGFKIRGINDRYDIKQLQKIIRHQERHIKKRDQVILDLIENREKIKKWPKIYDAYTIAIEKEQKQQEANYELLRHLRQEYEEELKLKHSL